MSETAANSNGNSATENVQKETGKPVSKDAFRLIDDNLFFWLGYNQFRDKVSGDLSAPKKGVTIGNLNTKRYVNFPATKSFYEMFSEHMINDILPAMKKFCDLEEDPSAPRIVDNL